MANNFYVIFRGEIADGFEIEDVKNSIGAILDEDIEAIEDLFSGRTLVIKRDPNLSQCQGLRDIFLSAGAVCYIRDSDGQTEQDMEQHDNLHAQDNDANSLAASVKSNAGQNTWLKLRNFFSDLLSQFNEILENLTYKITEFWTEASESIKSDLEVGGIKVLFKNNYFLTSLASSLLLLLVITLSFNYQRKTMPINADNFDKLLQHIEFIEKAFTIEELRTMTKDPSNFLDYLLADPIKKMGYDFDESIANIAHKYLNNGLTDVEQKKIKAYLEITAHERDKLFVHGLISKEIKLQLQEVSAKIGE